MSAQNETGQGLAETLKLFQEGGGFAELIEAVLRRHRQRGGTLGCGIAVTYATDAAREILERANQAMLIEAFGFPRPKPGMDFSAETAEKQKVHQTLMQIVEEAARKARTMAQQECAGSKKCKSKPEKVVDFQDSRSGESKMERHWGGPVKGNLNRSGHFLNQYAAAR